MPRPHRNRCELRYVTCSCKLLLDKRTRRARQPPELAQSTINIGV